MSGYYGSYDYGSPYPSVGQWETTSFLTLFRESLIREGTALFTELREQIMEPVPQNQNRLVIRPSVSSDVRAWWQTTASPLFAYFGNWISRGPLQNMGAWAKRLTQLRKEAAQLGLLVLPSSLFEEIDAELATSRGRTRESVKSGVM